MRIDWRVVPHKTQRYDSSGDWYWTEDSSGIVLNIRVSRLSDPRWEFLLGLHETVEAMLCHFAGVSQQEVDRFDMPLEAAHQAGATVYPCGCARRESSDPGSDKHAPYGFQHNIADAVERVVAAVLGIRWDDYDAEVDKPPDL